MPSTFMEGDSASAEVLSSTVILRPSDPINGTDRFKTKIYNLKQFAVLASTLESVHVPAIIKEINPLEIEVERAIGLPIELPNLRPQSLTAFLEIPTEIKLNALLVYLQLVQTCNTQGMAIIDHKGDSIFINHNLPAKPYYITVVDVGALEHINTNPWHYEVNPSNSSLSKLMTCFFTGGNDTDYVGCNVGEAAIIAKHLSEYHSAQQVIETFSKWRSDNTPPKNVHNSQWAPPNLTSATKNSTTQFEYDMNVAEYWRQFELNNISNKGNKPSTS